MRFISAFLFVSVIALLNNSCFSQPSEVQKYSTLCKVWGFLKYYHPAVTKGRIDWDKKLFEKARLIENAKTKEEINKVYSGWFDELGKVKSCKKCNNNVPDSLKYNLNINWINDTSVFTSENVAKLNFIKENRSLKQGYYIDKSYMPSPDFSKEKDYPGMKFPEKEYRLLGLYRYWNIVNYFFPYKYVIGEDWNTVLDEMIPVFSNCNDAMAYNLAIAQLTARVNDSHADFRSFCKSTFFGLNYPAFKVELIDDKAVVCGFYNDSLKALSQMNIGDVITEVNGRPVSEMIDEKEKYVSASNYPTKLRNLKSVIMCSNSESYEVTYERRGAISKSKEQLFSYNLLISNKFKNNKPLCDVLDSNIGYVNMGDLTRKQVDSVMKIMLDKKAIIFDIRNYPKGTMYIISLYLNKEKKEFVRFVRPDFSFPGVYKWVDPYLCGSHNENYYKGKVILLVNEQTQSHAEFTTMALQTAPDVTTIGSQTAGADGNVTTITFPGGYSVWMTGLGVYYPDGSPTQRVGVKVDIEVKPTIKGIAEGRDEVLERAIEFINSGK